MKLCRLIIVLGTAFVLTACGGISHRIAVKPGDSGLLRASEKAEALYEILANRNPGLGAFKGIGTATIRSGGKTQTARVAWMGSGREKLRLEVLGPAGRPALGFSNDGQWIYLVSHNPPRFYKKRSSGASLKTVLALPVHPGDIIALIAGRAPVRKHHAAVLISHGTADVGSGSSRREPPTTESVLVLKRFWGLVVEKIFFNETQNEIKQVEIYDADGSLAYRAVFNRMQLVNGYRVPAELLISDDKDTFLRLSIQRYWADVYIAPSRFVLTPPGEAALAD